MTNRTCACGTTIPALGPSRHYCLAAPATDRMFAVFVHGIHIGYVPSHFDAELLVEAELAQQAAEQLVQDETPCAWPDEYDVDYEDALRDAEADRRANEQREYDLAHPVAPVVQDDGFRASTFRSWNAARMAAHFEEAA